MESIESQSGALAKGELSKTPIAPEANSFLFTRAHVLYGKLRPYLNKVHVPAFDGKCSTELVPLRPSTELQREYLAYFLRVPLTVEKISQRVAGARMPRADMNFVMSLPIPLPPQDEQRRIVDLLSRAENIVRMRREAEAKAKEIIPALFLDMFGDPGTATMPWRKLSDMFPATRDGVKCGPFGSALKKHEYRDTGVPVWTMKNMTDEGFSANASLFVDEAKAAVLAAYRALPGDILISRAGTVGRVTEIPKESPEGLIHTNLVRISLDQEQIANVYFVTLMTYFGSRVARLKKSADEAYTFLSSAALPSLSIPVPPIQLQRAFEARVATIVGIRSAQLNALGIAEASFHSLLAGVFGEGA